MRYNFNKKINREGTNCIKYDFLASYYHRDDIQPLWIADMDFQTAPFISNAIIKRAKHLVYAYSKVNEQFYESIVYWMKAQHNWKIDTKDILHSSSVVASLSSCVEAFSDIGDEVIIQPPIYPPFFSVVTQNSRKLVTNPLIKKNDRYSINFKDLKNKITKKTKLLLLCSPHNPTGRVWGKKELEKLSKICLKHNIIIISDEIHADLSYMKKHIPVAKLSNDIANITVTLNSPGKSFNLAGITPSYIICKNNHLKDKLKKTLTQRVLNETNIFTNEIYSSAYTRIGQQWITQLVKYLKKNRKLTKEYFSRHNPKIKVIKSEATYLMLLDFSEIPLSHKQIKNKLINDAKVALNDGLSFGKNTHKHFRINIALPRKELKKALKKIAYTFL